MGHPPRHNRLSHVAHVDLSALSLPALILGVLDPATTIEQTRLGPGVDSTINALPRVFDVMSLRVLKSHFLLSSRRAAFVYRHRRQLLFFLRPRSVGCVRRQASRFEASRLKSRSAQA